MKRGRKPKPPTFCLNCGKQNKDRRWKFCSSKCFGLSRLDIRDSCAKCLCLCGFGATRIARAIGLTRHQTLDSIRRHGLNGGHKARGRAFSRISYPAKDRTFEFILADYKDDLRFWNRMENSWLNHPIYLKWRALKYYYKDLEKTRAFYREKARRQFRKMRSENPEAYQKRLKQAQNFRQTHPDIIAKYRTKWLQSDSFMIWKYRQKLGFSSFEEIPDEMVEIMRLQRKINQEVSRQQGAHMPNKISEK